MEVNGGLRRSAGRWSSAVCFEVCSLRSADDRAGAWRSSSRSGSRVQRAGAGARRAARRAHVGGGTATYLATQGQWQAGSSSQARRRPQAGALIVFVFLLFVPVLVEFASVFATVHILSCIVELDLLAAFANVCS